jgi:hypothetical protein
MLQAQLNPAPKVRKTTMVCSDKSRVRVATSAKVLVHHLPDGLLLPHCFCIRLRSAVPTDTMRLGFVKLSNCRL